MAKEVVIPQPRKGNKVFVYPEQLKERKANNRHEWGDLTGLANSILSQGILQSLLVRKLKGEKTPDDYPLYEVVVGNRRLRAAKKIADRMEEPDFVPVEILPDTLTATDIIYLSLTTDGQGLVRNMLEMGKDIQALVVDGQKQVQIAKTIGKSAQYVSDCLKLVTEATPEVIKQIESGQVAAYTVLEAIKAGNSIDEVEKTVTKVSENRAASGKKGAVNATALKEESGKAMSTKHKSTSAPETSIKQAGGDTKHKESDDLLKLIGLQTTLKANAGKQVKLAFTVLNGMIKFLKGTVTALDFLDVFFENEEATPAKKAAPPKKEAPAKKDVKKGKPAKSAKAADDEDEEAYEEDADLDLNEEDDDFIE